MAQTVWELIIANLVAALEGIKKPDYNNDVSGVFYWTPSGFPFAIGDLPSIGIVDGRQTIINREGVDVERWRRHIIIEMALPIIPDATGSYYSIEYQKALSDIAKAIQADVYRGGNAIDTLIDEAFPHVYDEAGAMACIVMASVQFGHLAGDLTTKA